MAFHDKPLFSIRMPSSLATLTIGFLLINELVLARTSHLVPSETRGSDSIDELSKGGLRRVRNIRQVGAEGLSSSDSDEDSTFPDFSAENHLKPLIKAGESNAINRHPSRNGYGESNSLRKSGDLNSGGMANSFPIPVVVLDTDSDVVPMNSYELASCPTCQERKVFQESTLPEQLLRSMRLEMIKQQILKKLRISEVDLLAQVPREEKPLPKPVVMGETLPAAKKGGDPGGIRDRDVEDFYGKTEQVIVFPEDLNSKCSHRISNPSACFVFNLPKQIRSEDVASAELWVYKLPDENDLSGQTFWVSELNSSSRAGTGSGGLDSRKRQMKETRTKSKLIEIKTKLRQSLGWFSLNISTAASRWMTSGGYLGNQRHQLQIECRTCEMEEDHSPIHTEGEHRPFIVFNMAGQHKKRRTRRYVNCSPGVTECCRERFVVDFKEIGLDNLIIGPSSYEAYFCKGDCMTLSARALSETQRTSIVHKYMEYYGRNHSRTAELKPCCTPSKMSSFRLFYQQGNNTILDMTLPNMVIESCGCI